MSWIAINKSTLYEAKVAALVDACDQAALAAGQAERAAGIIQGVVNEVRLAVATNELNQVDADLTTAPTGLRDLVVDLVVARLKNALEIALTEDERSAVNWRRRQLEQVASGELAVDQPAAAVAPEVQGGGGVTLVRPGAGAGTNPFGGLGTT
jgi:hypothetical protein